MHPLTFTKSIYLKRKKNSKSSVRKIKLSNKLLEKLIRTTRQGEHEVRSQGARDRRALTGEAGNASRRQVMVGAAARSPESAIAWRTQDESGPTFSRVMRTNFGGTTAKIFREHSDSLVYFGVLARYPE